MIELVFIACLKTDPAACAERVLSFVEDGARRSPVSCVDRAQPELAAWARAHPAFTIASWTCADGERRARDA